VHCPLPSRRPACLEWRSGPAPESIGGQSRSTGRASGGLRERALALQAAPASVGAAGEPVRRVQQALIDLGYDLGPWGADGAFGDATAAAVRAFKRDEELGFEP
jgi:peptidoglycan hydrolase-like protein with peptidoglycan-binding domain